jgi:hypothetical protein
MTVPRGGGDREQRQITGKYTHENMTKKIQNIVSESLASRADHGDGAIFATPQNSFLAAFFRSKTYELKRSSS